jgi:hypothetical protein
MHAYAPRRRFINTICGVYYQNVLRWVPVLSGVPSKVHCKVMRPCSAKATQAPARATMVAALSQCYRAKKHVPLKPQGLYMLCSSWHRSGHQYAMQPESSGWFSDAFLMYRAGPHGGHVQRRLPYTLEYLYPHRLSARL